MSLMRDLPFHLHVGQPVAAGWSDFQIDLGGESWICQPTWLGLHPLHDFIHAAVDLYDHLFGYPIPMENAVWDCSVVDEPGGITVRVVPQDDHLLKLSVFEYHDGYCPDPVSFPEIAAVSEGAVDYWTFADAVFDVSARTIVRQGFTSIRQQWESRPWDIDGHHEILPVERFLFLAALVRDREPHYGMSFDEELKILTDIQNKYRDG